MNTDELKTMLEKHRLWLEDNGEERADLRDANLQRTDLKQISKKAKDMILRYGVARVDAYGENDDFLDELEDNEFESLCSYIASLEAENRALRHALELRECEETEHKPDPLDGVPFVSLSNEEIAAMTPEHPLYKLVKGKEERNGQ